MLNDKDELNSFANCKKDNQEYTYDEKSEWRWYWAMIIAVSAIAFVVRGIYKVF